MTQYIDKATVVAEIERRIKETESTQPKFDQFWAGQISAFKGILKISSTLYFSWNLPNFQITIMSPSNHQSNHE